MLPKALKMGCKNPDFFHIGEGVNFDTQESKKKLLNECRRLSKMSAGSPDANVVRTYLDKCLALPWGVYTNDNLNLKNAQKQLDKDHFGLKDVKERIIEMLAARALSPDIKGQIICLAGPPGVGKTSIAKSVAKAVNKNYVRISLGGVRDEAEIRGHRRTYIGAIPGRIINAVIDSKSENPLILLDEVDNIPVFQCYWCSNKSIVGFRWCHFRSVFLEECVSIKFYIFNPVLCFADGELHLAVISFGIRTLDRKLLPYPIKLVLDFLDLGLFFACGFIPQILDFIVNLLEQRPVASQLAYEILVGEEIVTHQISSEFRFNVRIHILIQRGKRSSSAFQFTLALGICVQRITEHTV